jgi:hypothetical protein
VHAQDERKRRVQNLVEAAATSYGNGSPSNSRQSRDTTDKQSGDGKEQGKGEEEEITSPLKATDNMVKEPRVGTANRQLFQSQREDKKTVLRKRKTKSSSLCSSGTPDLNFPATDETGVVPTGLVLARVNQMAKEGERREPASGELTKKQ